jgi:hypothetical protein
MDEIGEFLRKYQLMELTTWELPYPQGPLADVPLDLARRLLGPGHPVSTLPAYYDVPSSQDVRQATRDQQQSAAGRAGLEGDYPVSKIGGHGDGPSAAEAAFRLWFIEQAVIGRYGKLHGLAERLGAAYYEIRGCESERVKQIRQAYLPFLPARD